MTTDQIPDFALPFTDIWRNMEFEIERLRAENEQFHKQAEMNARLLTENADLRQIIERLREAVKEAKDAEHQRWVKALLKVLPEEKAVLFREICVAAAMGESYE